MLKGQRVVLRPMQPEDVVRQHEFNQDIELYGLDSSPPFVSPSSRAQTFYEWWTAPDENAARFAIEADGKYLGDCSLSGLKNRHGNFELGIMIADHAYWGRGYGREVIGLLLTAAMIGAVIIAMRDKEAGK